MSADGFATMFSLSEIYFVTEKEAGVYSYRFQWSDRVIEAALNGISAPNTDDFWDDEDEEFDSEYFSARTFYDYIRANKNDNSDQATRYVVNIYSKSNGDLVKTIETTEKSVDVELNDGEYLWSVSAYKGNQLLKDSAQALMRTAHPSSGDGIEYPSDSSDFHKISEVYSMGAYSNVTCGRVDSFDGNCAAFVVNRYGEDAEGAYDAAQEGGYLFSPSANFNGFEDEFLLSENCLFANSGLYVYNEGKWDYVAYLPEVGTVSSSRGNYFTLDDEFWNSNCLSSVYSYDPVQKKIEVKATAWSEIYHLSSAGSYYLTASGVYTMDGNRYVCSGGTIKDDDQIGLTEYAYVHGYTTNAWGGQVDGLVGEAGSVKLSITPLNNGTAGPTQTFTLESRSTPWEDFCADDMEITVIGNLICAHYAIWDESLSPDGVTTFGLYEINGNSVQQITCRTIADYVLFSTNRHGDFVIQYNDPANNYEWTTEVLYEGAVAPTSPVTFQNNRLVWDGIEDDAWDQDVILSIARQGAVGGVTVRVSAYDGNSLDLYGISAGTYECSFRLEDETSAVKNTFTVRTSSNEPQEFQCSGLTNLLFARKHGVWSGGYAAEYQGAYGTVDLVQLKGKNRLEDVFTGGYSAATLVLTDDANGDALFLDDAFSAFGDRERVSGIDEIFAGAGDDIVDLTSSKFDSFSYNSIIVRGGDGNDVIWAGNTYGNKLFGDAGDDVIIGSGNSDVIVGGSGNDTMYNGGGSWIDDTFVFCENWGNDTVVIGPDEDGSYYGTVTLWFNSGSVANWDAENRVYRSGSNSVTVVGGENVSISLRFGNDGVDYEDLVEAGAFEAESSKRIWGTIA